MGGSGASCACIGVCVCVRACVRARARIAAWMCVCVCVCLCAQVAFANTDPEARCGLLRVSGYVSVFFLLCWFPRVGVFVRVYVCLYV